MAEAEEAEREAAAAAVAAVEALLTPSPADRPELYGDGHAGDRVVAALILGA